MSRGMIWTGRVLSGLAALFFAFDTGIKLLQMPVAVDSTVQLGYTAAAVPVIGVIEAACLLLYLVPRTAVLGALLFTAFLGGAVASHLRHGDGVFGFVLAPVYFGLVLWAGLWLRDGRARMLTTYDPRAAASGAPARV
ncbi:MAG TPA: DoxX family protein [Vicinamibacterales bacterium]|nr:DoxX family protein [Vicinamibacterales bacterium]